MGISFYRKTLDEIKGDTEWSAAEKKLLDEAQTGFVLISETRPDAETDDNKIRAELIRHITLGGCNYCRVTDSGVRIVGAFIGGILDLEACQTPLSCALYRCRFNERPFLRDAQLNALHLSGSVMPGLTAHRLRTTQDLLLNDHFQSDGPIDLVGASIGGTLACNASRFDGRQSPALSMDGVNVGGDLFLSDGFEAIGEVSLTCARIIGQVACDGGKFNGQNIIALNMNAMTVEGDLFLRQGFTANGLVNLIRSSIGGGLRIDGSEFNGAIIAEAMSVCGPFYLSQLKSLNGRFDLTDAHVGRLHDDAEAWKGADPLILNGFRYDRLTGTLSIGERLSWLASKHETPILPALRDEAVTIDGQRYDTPMPYRRTDFGTYCDPQPYTQLAKVLREQGMALGAARVLEARDRRVLAATFNRRMAAVDGSLAADIDAALALIKRPFDWLFGAMFGYGHRPGRALFAVLGILAINWALYAQVWEAGQMAPTSDVVLTSEAWTRHVALLPDGDLDTSVNTLQAWANSEAAQDYTTFNAALYALDLFIPLDALGQEAAWAPSPVRGVWGTIGFATGWLTQLSGWLITAIAAAAVAGIVGRKD